MTGNRLINENSIYLRNHANQHIDWYPWGGEAFERAKAENKLIFISIGFSACHWCHELSRNCFEDETIAEALNRYYVCIKVDREERPDVDMFYMSVLELVTNYSGWPITCFALPDGSPVFAGTYYPPDQFLEVVLNLQQTFELEPDKLEEVGLEIVSIMKNTGIVEKKAMEKLSVNDLKLLIEPWRRKFDAVNGGTLGAPKFPLPMSLTFMMSSGYYLDDPSLIEYVEKTLDSIAKGGIYDQLGGGFFRYTEDTAWKRPHFEKMLLDNALLIVAYSRAYRINPKPLYKKVIEDTINFMRVKMLGKKLYYASIDAESEDIEGRYYTWHSDELREILGNDYEFAAEYFGIRENVQNVLFVHEDIECLSEKHGLSLNEVRTKINTIKNNLLQIRTTRKLPSIDTKMLVSWNSLFMGALCEAYRSLEDAAFLEQAQYIADYIIEYYVQKDYRMFRIVENKTPAFLDDYALTANALIRLYRISGDRKYLKVAKGIVEYTFEHFYDEKSGMFFFSDNAIPSLIPRMMDFVDKTYPSSNSMMAKVVTIVSLLYNNKHYANVVLQMLNNIKDQMPGAGPYVAHWASVFYMNIYKQIIAFIPTDKLKNLITCFVPNLLIFPDNVDSCAQNIPQDELDKIEKDYYSLVEYAKGHKQLI
ncbi:MAG: thioredoxin domain-containing protein [Prevotellaceae bacterium]|nr:thioredoxin domain-containing protein [Prevotellaceae bacterium]